MTLQRYDDFHKREIEKVLQNMDYFIIAGCGGNGE